MSDAFDLVPFRGVMVDRKTMAFILEMEARLDYQLTVVQGYNPDNFDTSAGTHGRGVIDLADWDWRRKVRVAADLGAFAYYRPALPGVWGPHIHLGIRNHGALTPSAQRQQDDWDARPPRNGLAGHDLLDLSRYYHPMKAITFQYPVKEAPVAVPVNNVTKARDSIVEAMHACGTAAALLDSADPDRAALQEEVPRLRKRRSELQNILNRLPKK